MGDDLPPPPSSPPWLSSRSGTAALACGGFVVYVICAHLVPAIVLLVVHGETDPAAGEALAMRNIANLVAASTVASLTLLAALHALGWLAPDPPRLAWRPALAWIAGCTAACLLGEEAIAYLLTALGSPPQEQPALVEAAKSGGLAFMLAIVVVGPAGEELVFRRFLYGTLERGWGRWPAIVGSSVLFALIHFNPTAFALYLWIAICCAVVYQRTGSIWAAITVHAINNGFALSPLLRAG